MHTTRISMHGFVRTTTVAFLLVLLLWLALAYARPAQAGGVVGSGTPASCTEAALDGALAGGGTVTFNCGTAPVTITLTSQKVIASDTTVHGAGKVTLSGGGAPRLFTVSVGAVLTLTNLVLRDGFVVRYGGAVAVNGELVLSNGSQLYGNVARGADALGGALYVGSTGRARIEDSLLASNVATGTNASGGGIYALGALTVTNSVLSGNSATYSGGGIENVGAVTLTNVALSGNSAPQGVGGGIADYGKATLTNVSLSGNSAYDGGGIYNRGTATLTNAALSGNTAQFAGGGIENQYGTVTLTNVTLSGNMASSAEGGGIDNYQGTATLTNVTLSGNTANSGGGIDNSGTVTLTNVTLSGNSATNGGGIVHFGAFPTRTLTLKNTLVANSPSGGNCLQFGGSVTNITSNGNNLSSDGTCTAYFTQTLPVLADWNNVSANLGPLANNGGFTLTHLPLPGSVAIDHGDACPSPDQRGVTRPQGPRCDIGAVEYRTGETTPWLLLPLLAR